MVLRVEADGVGERQQPEGHADGDEDHRRGEGDAPGDLREDDREEEGQAEDEVDRGSGHRRRGAGIVTGCGTAHSPSGAVAVSHRVTPMGGAAL